MAAEVAEHPNDQSYAGTSGRIVLLRDGLAIGSRWESGGLPGTRIPTISRPSGVMDLDLIYRSWEDCGYNGMEEREKRAVRRSRGSLIRFIILEVGLR